MKVHSIYNTSDGNATRVYNKNKALLIDCGVSMKKLFWTSRFKIDAIFLTHEHSDHASGVGVIGRATSAPIYIHEDIYDKIKKKYPLNNCKVNIINENEPILVGDFIVESYRTSHDVIGYYFIITETPTNAKYCHLTDTGTFLPSMYEKIIDCDAILLETNYDERKLELFQGYTEWNKNRIKSDVGHLGIQQTIDFIKDNVILEYTQWVGLGHLSPRTNDYKTVHERLYSNFPEYKHFFCFPGNTFLEIVNPDDFIYNSTRNVKYQYRYAKGIYSDYVKSINTIKKEYLKIKTKIEWK